MKYTVEKQDEYAVLTLQEENLNSVKAPDLKSELIVLRNAGIKNLILNLEHVKYVDSSGLSAILTGNRLWTEGGNAFVLVGVAHPSVKTLITISRLDSVLNIANTLPEAIKAVMLEALREEIESEAEEGEDEEE
jgi:anti-anti-sigma factor